jgi:hypothetical protein
LSGFFAVAGDGLMDAFGECSEPRIVQSSEVSLVPLHNVSIVHFTHNVTIGALTNRGWKSFGFPTERANRKRFYHTSFDRPVPVTARNFLAGSDLIDFCTCRLILRLQHLDSSDPNVHRAHKTAQKECGWKHGERVVCSNVLKKLYSRHTGKPNPLVALASMFVVASKIMTPQKSLKVRQMDMT